jgi:hypothetical protein
MKMKIMDVLENKINQGKDQKEEIGDTAEDTSNEDNSSEAQSIFNQYR